MGGMAMQAGSAGPPGCGSAEVPFTIRDIPAAMRANGWNVGARLMDRWFARPARAMRLAEKTGDAPSPDIETRMVTMGWALRYRRVAAARDHLLQSWAQPPRLAAAAPVLESRVRRWRRTKPGPFRFGDLGAPAATLDQTCQINREIVESSVFGPIDDFYAAIGNAAIKLAVSGMVTPGPRGRLRVAVDELGLYLRDTYDFIDEQGLGRWKATGMTRVGFLAPEVAIAADEARDDPNQYWNVSNASFRRYRARFGHGGDFLILSDVVRVRLARPVIVDLD
jgi:hypothetical protein